MRPPKSNMYRMPWSLNDNAIGWLEVTDACNIHCRGCYRRRMEGHKPLEQIKEEVRIFKEMRNCDNLSIAGGEPLIHPDIVEIVAYIRELGMKPALMTNAVRLTDNRPFLEELKQAGAFGFMLHVDSEQERPGWTGKKEEDLFELRLEYARMIHDVGGLHCSVGATIYPTTLHEIPKIVKWANANADVVNGIIFIAYRAAPLDGTYDYYANGKKLTDEEIGVTYTAEDATDINLTSADIYEEIKQAQPNYEPSAYLGGSQTTDAIKWLLNNQIGAKGEIYGSFGARAMELTQVFHHYFQGTYLAYTSVTQFPKYGFLLSLFDKGVREALGNYGRAILRNPGKLFAPVYNQSIAIIQAPDILADGRQDMCDSCPDMTVYNGQLVHSCRMDEWRLHGTYMTAQPHQATPEVETAPSSNGKQHVPAK